MFHHVNKSDKCISKDKLNHFDITHSLNKSGINSASETDLNDLNLTCPTRKSNIELLRILCIFGILVMHILGSVKNNLSFVNGQIDLFLNSIFNANVTIFVLISGYFGIKFKLSKVLKIWIVVLFYSILYTLLTCDYSYFDIKLLIHTIFPVLTDRFWFISCYIVLYFLSPYINKFIEALNKKDALSMIFILLFFFSIAPTLLLSEGITFDYGKGFVNVVLSYLIGRCISLGYINLSRKQSIILGSSSIVLTYLLMAFISYCNGKVMLKYFFNDNSLLVIITAVCIFNIFNNLNFSSKFINFIAKHVLAVYLFQYAAMDLFGKILDLNYFAGSSCFYLIFIAYTFLLFVFCIVFDIIRDFVFGKLEDKIIFRIIDVWNKKSQFI